MAKREYVPTEWDASRLRAYIKDHQITQDEFAWSIGVGHRTVQRWLSGHPIPGPARACLDAWERHEEILKELNKIRVGQRIRVIYANGMNHR